jgi:hypothetical protein
MPVSKTEKYDILLSEGFVVYSFIFIIIVKRSITEKYNILLSEGLHKDIILLFL